MLTKVLLDRSSALILSIVLGGLTGAPSAIANEPVLLAEGISQAQDRLETITVTINDKSLLTEVADQTRERFKGLSFRETLETNAGMLFVYPKEKELLFTMRNTSIPLSIAFVSAKLEILEILDMVPFEDGPYPSAKPARFALEVNSGWFNRNNISAGDKLILERPL